MVSTITSLMMVSVQNNFVKGKTYMNFLVVGLGSMGKRRIRCLHALGFKNVFGYDPREDRRNEAQEKYGTKTFASYDDALSSVQPTALIISVPPDVHHEYMLSAIKNKLHFFVEASVVDTNLSSVIEEVSKIDIVAAPSATLLFHPAIRLISDIIAAGQIGKVSNIILHSGQYLPDWHIYEDVSEFYVSNPTTGGAREIVPFELTWLTRIFGFPHRVMGTFRKTIEIKGAERIDDTYNFLLDYGNYLAAVTVDVVSRYATRRLLINGDLKQLIWDWNENCVKLYDPQSNTWDSVPYSAGLAEAGYNQNIGENMYIDEIRNFLEAINKNEPFINTLENDHKILKLLYAIEESDTTSRAVRVG
ncbi:MAG: Gfo/Idh/MocA family protein [Bacillota bacterium]